MAEHGARWWSLAQAGRLRPGDEGDQRKIRQGHAVSIAANISSKENLQHLVDESNRAFGRIDVLVCNAASNPYYGPLGAFPTISSGKSSTITSSPTTG